MIRDSILKYDLIARTDILELYEGFDLDGEIIGYVITREKNPVFRSVSLSKATSTLDEMTLIYKLRKRGIFMN